MGPLLTLTLAALSLAAASAAVAAASRPADHGWIVQLDLGANIADTRLDSWTEAGLGKLRYDEAGASDGSRLFAEYRGRIASNWWATAAVDYVADASSGVDVTEAYVEWRPLPTTRNKQQWRFGAFYPPLSLENGGDGWSSPLTVTYSAVNTWIGEEIRPIGAEWSMRRRLGFAGSPHQVTTFAAAFYGNDPAGTLLFWRGWSLHDRQSRLGDVLPLPSIPRHDDAGGTIGSIEHHLEPFDEIDGRPGFYAGAGWQFARRAALQIAHYDNRADPSEFSGGQWGWKTRFTQVSAQVALPGRVGLATQWLNGRTDWLSGALPSGRLMPGSRFVSDDFDARFLLLTRPLRDAHTLSIRYDDFEYSRPADRPAFVPDSGRAFTLAYRYRRSPRLGFIVEWLDVESDRDLWPQMFDAPPHADERLLQLKIILTLGGGAPPSSD